MWPFRRRPTTEVEAELAQAYLNIHQLKARIRALQRNTIISTIDQFVKELQRVEEPGGVVVVPTRHGVGRPAGADQQVAGEPHRPGPRGRLQNPNQADEGRQGRDVGQGDNQDRKGADTAGVPGAVGSEPGGEATPGA